MSAFSLSLVAVRILALYCFVQSIPLFGAFGLVNALSRTEDPFDRTQTSAVIAALIPGASLLIVAILLFVFSVPLARRLVKGALDETTSTVCSFEQLQLIAFAVAGILILAFALPSLLRAIELVVELRRSKTDGGPLDAHQIYDTWLYCIGIVAQVAAGLALLFNPAACRNAWHWLRTAGTARSASPSA